MLEQKVQHIKTFGPQIHLTGGAVQTHPLEIESE
jgi:hypothetical protein